MRGRPPASTPAPFSTLSAMLLGGLLALIASVGVVTATGGLSDSRTRLDAAGFSRLDQRPGHQAREAQVLAQIASREETITQVERDLESDVWRNVKLLETETQNIEAAQLLLNAASQSYQITFGRYKAGVGSILELLATQTALSNARSQLAQAQIALAAARLRLEVASGRMLLTP